jgi:hypothetical protein
MTRRFLAVVLVVSMIVCTGCASTLRIDGPYEGKVIDAETRQPVEGAVVHGSWYKVQLGGAHEYYDSYEVLTDKNGEFKIPGKGLLVLSEIEGMTLIIFKAGYKEWTPNLWSGLKQGKWLNDEVVWNGNKGTFKLQRMTMEERKKRIPPQPDGPSNKQRKFRIESNKEMIETGMPANTLLPVE